MNPTKEDVKEWLKRTGRDREWLAKQCGTGKRAVDKWFETKGTIPAKAILVINSLMAEDSPAGLAHEPAPYSIELNFSHEEMAIINAYGDSHPRFNPKTYAEQRLIEFCAQLTEKERIASAATRHVSTVYSDNREHPEHIEHLAAEAPAPFYPSVTDFPPVIYEIERVGNIAAGSLHEGDGLAQTMRTAKQYPADHYALRVCGHSMAPVVNNEDTIIVKPWEYSYPPKRGTIVVYADERGVTLKKLDQRDGKPVLTSINPDYPEVTPMDGGTITATYVETLG